MKTILLLGSGELGKEFAIAAQRLGQTVVACDKYAGAPAMQVADAAEVFDMLDGDALAAAVAKHRPDIIVPEIEAIRTERLYEFERAGVQVVPSARAVNFTMNRKAIRDLAAKELGLKTARYFYAASLGELREAAAKIGFPCVVKPVMSSSGHGQSVVRSADKIEDAWNEAQTGRRAHGEGDVSRVIIEQLVDLDYELTMLTVSSSAGIVVCEPIGQRQESGDYRDSWQPAAVEPDHRQEVKRIATQAVQGLIAHAGTDTAWGVFGVELFVLKDGTVLFNEVSPRPHDTGMVTMISQYLSEFDLHARAVLGIPVSKAHIGLDLPKYYGAASHAIVVEGNGEVEFSNLQTALATPGTDLRIFSKPRVEGHRRMGVTLAIGSDIDEARIKANECAQNLRIVVNPAK